METTDRRKIRSLTQASYFGKPGVRSTHFKVLRRPTVNPSFGKSKTPVYTPGPKPSALLINYLNSSPPKKIERIDEIKKSLHSYSKSCHFHVIKKVKF
jgi:hypothetical protein